MTRLMRMAPGMPVAAAITFFLFLGMMTMVSVEYTPIQRIETPPIDIFVEVDPADPPDRTSLDVVEPVQPPPPPVRLEVVAAAVDAAPVAETIGSLPEIGGVEIGQTSFEVPDREETPIVRIEPIYPQNLLARDIEGDCIITYDIAANGHPFNVSADCTNSGFVRSAERAVEGWRFNPRRVDGENVVRSGRRTTLNFRIAD